MTTETLCTRKRHKIKRNRYMSVKLDLRIECLKFLKHLLSVQNMTSYGWLVGWLAAVSRLTLVYVTNETDAVVTDPITQGKIRTPRLKICLRGHIMLSLAATMSLC